MNANDRSAVVVLMIKGTFSTGKIHLRNLCVCVCVACVCVGRSFPWARESKWWEFCVIDSSIIHRKYHHKVIKHFHHFFLFEKESLSLY